MYTKDRCLFVCLDLAPKVLDESQKKASKEFLSVSFGTTKDARDSFSPTLSLWTEVVRTLRRPVDVNPFPRNGGHNSGLVQ